MNYVSTRDKNLVVTGAEAVVQGMAEGGGLFVPEAFPQLLDGILQEMAEWPYARVAAWVLGQYFDEFPAETLEQMAEKAYGVQFDDAAVAPLSALDDNTYLLELYHGPTLAFKDMALQMLPLLMPQCVKRTGEEKEICILVATSGDTGKAALEGFRDIPQMRIGVCYPAEGVSPAQKRQMVTQEGGNVFVLAIDGNFDDAQTCVKRIFSNDDIARTLDTKGIRLSSANSINWGRLAPQIAYYVYAYAQLLGRGLKAGSAVNFAVPTGNFGNILAAYYARRMGLPLRKLVCASNANRVLYDFFTTGEYTSRRAFYTTLSPSMDILISSNLERLLFEAAGRDDALVNGWMRSLRESGAFHIGGAREWMEECFQAGWGDDDATRACILGTFAKTGRVLDPHTAVAMHVVNGLPRDETPMVVVATASPFKFASAVLDALEPGAAAGLDDFAAADALAAYAGCAVPKRIAELKNKPVLHKARCAPEDMERVLMAWLSL